MITPITRRDVIAHQSVVPWPGQVQVEQDLWLCRTMAALFGDAFLRSQIAMRGGTLLHKVYLARPPDTARTLIWWWSVIARRGMCARHSIVF